MKKNGFTLTELIITLSVIGVVSAFIMPAITKLMPDRNKTKVLALYSQVVNAVGTVFENERNVGCLGQDFESVNVNGTVIHVRSEGLACPTDAVGGPIRYENLIADELGILEFGRTLSFDGRILRGNTPDEVAWFFERGFINGNNFTVQNQGLNTDSIRITVNLNGNNADPEGIYTPNSQRPDNFRFIVDNYGAVIPNDAMTAAYLRTSFKNGDKRSDRETAEGLYGDNAAYQVEEKSSDDE